MTKDQWNATAQAGIQKWNAEAALRRPKELAESSAARSKIYGWVLLGAVSLGVVYLVVKR